MRQVNEIMTDGQYLPVAALSPEVSQAIDDLRVESRRVIDDRSLMVAQGRAEEVPLAIDALSTADSVVEARDTYGLESVQFRERRSALELDCLRLVKEWNRKLKPEYFGKLRHHFSQPEEEFYSHGLAVGQMTFNALRPIPESQEEELRRINERVEDKTPVIIQKVGGFALGLVGIRTISECSDKAIEDFKRDQEEGSSHTGYDGMVPEVEKAMIRDIRLDPETGDRIQEQVGVIGKYSITHLVIQEALHRKGIDTSGLDKTGLHSLQLLVDDNLKDFVKLLDQVASEEWCVPIFMGERVDESHPRDYDVFWEEAEQREEDLMGLAEVTASFVIDLAEDGFDRKKAPAHVEEFVKKLLLREAKEDIEVARNAFGDGTVEGILDVLQLEREGKYDAASARMLEVEKAAPGGGYCSGGSCGLESVNLRTEEGKQLKVKLKAEDGDTIVKDKERNCRKCKQKGTVVYAYNAKKVNKYCEGCHAFESKVSKA